MGMLASHRTLVLVLQAMLLAPEGAPRRFGAVLAAEEGLLAVTSDHLRERQEPRGLVSVYLYEGTEGDLHSPTRVDVWTGASRRVRGVGLAVDDGRWVVGTPGEFGMYVAGWRQAPEGPGALVTVHERSAGGEWRTSCRLLQAYRTSEFGAAVALSGGTLVVGAPSEMSSYSDWGALRVYERDGPRWTPLERLVAPDPVRGGGELGRALDLDGDRLVAGAPGIPFTIGGGPTQVFERRGGEWVLDGLLRPSIGPRSGSPFEPPDSYRRGRNFGVSVAIAGTVVAVGAPTPSDAGPCGAVWIFERIAGEWRTSQCLQPPESDPVVWFGASLHLEPGLLLVSSARPCLPAGERPCSPGAVYGYRRQPGGPWKLAGPPLVGEPWPGAEFGTAIAVAGDALFVGAPGADGGRGAVFRYSIPERFPGPRRGAEGR